jgi:hypothetical protein
MVTFKTEEQNCIQSALCSYKCINYEAKEKLLAKFSLIQFHLPAPKNYFPNNYSNKINNTSEKFSKQCKNYKQIYQNVFFF